MLGIMLAEKTTNSQFLPTCTPRQEDTKDNVTALPHQKCYQTEPLPHSKCYRDGGRRTHKFSMEELE